MKKALVCGAGGFIGGHLVKKLKEEGFWVRGADIKQHEFTTLPCDDFILGDLRDNEICKKVLDGYFDEVYQLAADMGGAGYIFTGENDASVMHNSALINLQIVELARIHKVGKIFYSSSACVYPAYNQKNPELPTTNEASVLPADPDSEYGWEKLFSERLFLSYCRNYGLNVKVARFHNIFGPEGTWTGGKEKAPAALCRKVAEVNSGSSIEIWGDGNQTRSFLYIDECLVGIRKLMDSEFNGPVNLGSEEMVSINQLAEMIIHISGKKITLNHVKGPQGVRGRNSDNNLIFEKLNWKPSSKLNTGLEKTYQWISGQVKNLQNN